jgi:hypothetical protein
MADLLALNGLTEEDAIFPDQQLLIVRGSGETPEPTPTEPSKVEMQASAQKAPTVTPRPTRMSDPTPQTSVTMETTLEVNNQGNFITNIFSGDSLLIGIGLVLVSVLGIVLLLYTSSRLK